MSINEGIMNKNDKRYINTEEKIRNSYTSLRKRYPSKNLSVSDICKDARINRSSFYLHYLNVEALINAMEEDAFHELIKIVRQYHCDVDIKEIIHHLFREMSIHRNIIEYAIYCSKDSAAKFSKIVSNIFICRWKEISGLTEEDMEIIYYYLSAGTVAVFKQWIERGYPPYEKYADMLAALMMDGLYSYAAV